MLKDGRPCGLGHSLDDGACHLQNQTEPNHAKPHVLKRHVASSEPTHVVLEPRDARLQLLADRAQVAIDPNHLVLKPVAHIRDPIKELTRPPIELGERGLVTPSARQWAVTDAATGMYGAGSADVNRPRAGDRLRGSPKQSSEAGPTPRDKADDVPTGRRNGGVELTPAGWREVPESGANSEERHQHSDALEKDPGETEASACWQDRPAPAEITPRRWPLSS